MIFRYLTPVVYYLLILIWGYIFIFYLRKMQNKNINDKLLQTLLFILAIDSLRTFIESLFFGIKYTSQNNLFLTDWQTQLEQPYFVFVPKALNLGVALIIFFILLKKWLPAESSRRQNIDNLIKKQKIKLQKVIDNLYQTKEELNKSRDDYKNRFIYFPFPVFIWQKRGDDFEMVTANDAAYKDSNGKIKDVFNVQSKILWKEEPELTQYLHNAYDQKTSFTILREYTFRATNSTKYVSATYSFLPPDSVQIVTVDITEQKNAEKELIRQKILFETMFNSISDGVIITNSQREIMVANKGMNLLFGYNPEELIGQSAEKIYAQNSEFVKAGNIIFNELNKENEKRFETEYRKKHGEIFKGETFGAKLFDTQNQWIGNLAIIRDITERIEFIDALSKAKEKAEESDKLKTEFMNNLSHEIRTPLNGILGFSGLLAHENTFDKKQLHYINIIQNSGQQLLRIIDEIVEISELVTKQVNINFRVISFHELLMDLYHFFRPMALAKNISLFIKKQHKRNPCFIYSDYEKLQRILNILIENAIKYTENGFIKIGYSIKDERLEIFVQDTGIGIEKDKFNEIFALFAQVEKEISKKTGGLGLGLCIAREYIKLLEGNIFLTSEVEKGSTFYIQIPYKAMEINKNNLNIQDMEQENKNIVLVAEDEEINFLYIETILEDEIEKDLHILHAKNGLEAVKICENNPEIKLVLMDIKMPKMNGNQATMHIRTFRPLLPIVAQTAFTTDEDKKEALDAGCNDFISKPIDREILIELIKKYIP